MARIGIRALDRSLTDGSLVFDVSVVDRRTGTGLTLPAVTEKDALELARKIADAILSHTNEEVVLAAGL